MGRTLCSGAQVLVTSSRRPAPGEVWAFCNDDGEIVVHRCVWRRHTTWGFQGDRAAHPDAPVGPDRLIGRVVTAEHDLRLRRFGLAERLRTAPERWLRRLVRRVRSA